MLKAARFAPRLRARAFRKPKSLKTMKASDDFWKFNSPKFAPRLRSRTIWKSKSLIITKGAGALLKVQVAKIFTTPARENDLDLEVKIVKAPGSRTTFWGSKCFSRGRRRDFDTLQNTWQAQEFLRVAKTLAGVVDLKRVRNDACRVAGARISCFVYVAVWSLGRRIRGRVANFMCYFTGIISRGMLQEFVYALAQLYRGRRSTFEASI